MPVVEMDTFFAIFLFAGITVLFGLWFFYERRDVVLTDRQRFVTIFHCVKCDLLFTRKRIRPTAPCPRCGFINARLKF